MHIDHYAVIGHPVAHSLSPRIHTLFARQTGQQLDYVAIDAHPDGFPALVRARMGADLSGANVTVPFKAEACALADRLDSRAARAGAVNTLRREPDGSLSGFNTDGPGLVRDLMTNLGCDLHGAAVVLIGAGGAAAGVIEALCEAGVGRLCVANRTASRAEALVARFASGWPLSACTLDAVPAADVLVNATSASLGGAVPALPDRVVCAGTLAYDMMYGAAPTPFLAWARERGAANCADGFGMLVEQAAEAFLLWRDVRPDTVPVMQALRPSS